MTLNYYQKNFLPSTIKIVIIGGAKVGKSLLAAKFVDSRLIPDQNVDNTVEETYKKKCKVDGEEITLEIIDTPGMEEYNLSRQHHMRLGHGFLLVFSMQNRHSFEEVLGMYWSILKYKDRPYFPMVLVGNSNIIKKKDEDLNLMFDDPMEDEESECNFNEKVSSEEGLEMSRKLGLSYIETNIMSGMNVHLVFHELVRTIRNFWKIEKRPIEEEKGKRSFLCF